MTPRVKLMTIAGILCGGIVMIHLLNTNQANDSFNFQHEDYMIRHIIFALILCILPTFGMRVTHRALPHKIDGIAQRSYAMEERDFDRLYSLAHSKNFISELSKSRNGLSDLQLLLRIMKDKNDKYMS